MNLISKLPPRYKPSHKKSGGVKKFSPPKKSARQKGYDNDWQRYRFRFLHHNPFCYSCGSKATVVDHIKAHKGDMSLFKATNNHIPLCSTCHNYITGKFDRKDKQDLEGKIEYLQRQRIKNNISTSVKVLPSYYKNSRGR